MFFSSGETAFISCNLLKLKYFSLKLNRAKKALSVLKDKNTFLITSLIGNSIVNIIVGVLITSITVHHSSSPSTSVKAAGLSTLLLLVFGEIVPKSISLSFPEKIAMYYSSLNLILMKILYPASYVFLKISTLFLKMFNINIDEKNLLVSEDDLRLFFEQGTTAGIISKDEKEVMSKILKYDDILVKHAMTPRIKIISLKAESKIESALELSQKTSLSRFPVYQGDIDEIIGILYIKDLFFSKKYTPYLKTEQQEVDEGVTIEGFLRKPCFIFANTHLRAARQMLKKHGQNMGIVIDEYGGTLGLITLEDLNEEIFGEIVDEHDAETMQEKTEEMFLKRNNDGTFVLGSSSLNLINEKFNLALHSKDSQSIAGVIMERLGELPKEGSSIEEDGMLFVVTKMNGNKIEEVCIKEKKL